MVFQLGPVVLVAAVMAAPPQDATSSAHRFVQQLYDTVAPALPDDRIYTPDLAKLIARAAEIASNTDDPDLVGNALCDCQNLNELRASITVVSATASAASVRVLLTGGVDGPKHFLLKLVRTSSGWRLSDSIDSEGGSYAAYLRSAIAAN